MINFESVKRFCCDDIALIENYPRALASNEKFDCHHRFGTDLGLTKDELIARGLYWNRPASELVFLTHREHISLHHKGKPSPHKGKTHTKETRLKMSLAKKGKPSPTKGKPSPNKGKPLKEVTRLKMSLAHKGKQLRWITPDGKIVYMAKGNATYHHPGWKLAAQTDSIALF